jgi:SAM-dependent methyltransferase
VCLNAFEHYRDPSAVMAEVWRVLKPGGRLFLHTAFLQPMHEEPFHFYNCTRYGLERWLERFDVEEIGVSDNFNPLYALSWLASDLEAGFESLSTKEARTFRETRIGDLSDFWRKREQPDERLARRFSTLPLETQERAAAGWQALARKPVDEP